MIVRATFTVCGNPKTKEYDVDFSTAQNYNEATKIVRDCVAGEEDNDGISLIDWEIANE